MRGLILLLIIPASVMGQDFSNIKGATEDSLVIPKVSFSSQEKEKVLRFSHIKEKVSPKWNLNGSWKNIKDRKLLIEHLLKHPNHLNKFKRYELEALNIKQLWTVHDTDHDGRKIVIDRSKVVESEPYCPPGSS